jgi:hypothetical protein
MTEGQAPPPPPPPTQPPAEPPAQPPPPPPGYQPATPGAPGGGAYVVRADASHQEEYARFMPLIKWLLLIPHYVCLAFLGFAAFVVFVIAWFAVVFTRTYPRGMFDFVLGVQRWGWRVGAYLFLLTDEYPPFTLEDVPDYPARLIIDYPEQGVDRWRPFLSWFLIYPFQLVTSVLLFVAFLAEIGALFAILFTKRYPDGLFRFVVNALRWSARSTAYQYFMTTKYPPFEFEDVGNPASV